MDNLPSDQIVVEIKGVDVYDPTTGQIRNASTDDIACWFIDTDNNGESFYDPEIFWYSEPTEYNAIYQS